MNDLIADPLYIAFEGGEGCGKSTQALRLSDRLGAVLTREPGRALEGAIRQLLLDPRWSMSDRCEALLMAADRAEHVESVVRPALDAGRHVVSDRSAVSSLAYQGFGRGLDVFEVAALSNWALGGALVDPLRDRRRRPVGLWPDLVIVLRVSAEVRLERMLNRGETLDRIESADDAFHRRVDDGLLALAERVPDRFVVVDGDGAPDEVAGRVWSTLLAWDAQDGLEAEAV